MDLVLVPVEVFVAILVAAIAMIALLATARITGATCLQAARRAAEKHRLASALAVSAGVLAGFLLPVTALAVSTRIGSPVFGLTTPLVVMTTSCLTALVACLVVAALRGRVGLGRTSRATPRRGVTSTLVPEASPTYELVDVREPRRQEPAPTPRVPAMSNEVKTLHPILVDPLRSGRRR